MNEPITPMPNAKPSNSDNESSPLTPNYLINQDKSNQSIMSNTQSEYDDKGYHPHTPIDESLIGLLNSEIAALKKSLINDKEVHRNCQLKQQIIMDKIKQVNKVLLYHINFCIFDNSLL